MDRRNDGAERSDARGLEALVAERRRQGRGLRESPEECDRSERRQPGWFVCWRHPCRWLHARPDRWRRSRHGGLTGSDAPYVTGAFFNCYKAARLAHNDERLLLCLTAILSFHPAFASQR